MRKLSNSGIRPELSLWMQAIGGSVREWRGRRELRGRENEVYFTPEAHYYDPAEPLAAVAPSLMTPAPRITGYGRGHRRTALAVAAIVAAAAIPAFAITSVFTGSGDDDGVPSATVDPGTVGGAPNGVVAARAARQLSAAGVAAGAAAAADPAAPPATHPVKSTSKQGRPAAVAAPAHVDAKSVPQAPATVAAEPNSIPDQRVGVNLPEDQKPLAVTPANPEKPQSENRPARAHRAHNHSGAGSQSHAAKHGAPTASSPVAGKPATDSGPQATGARPNAPQAPAAAPQAPAAAPQAPAKAQTPPAAPASVDPAARPTTVQGTQGTAPHNPSSVTEQGKPVDKPAAGAAKAEQQDPAAPPSAAPTAKPVG